MNTGTTTAQSADDSAEEKAPSPAGSPSSSASLSLDVLVVGFGKAGKTIAMKRAKAGDRVAIVEKSPSMYGGTCINIACVPTKTLLVSAERHAHSLDDDHDSAFDGADEFLGRYDRDVAATVHEHLASGGIQIISGAKATGFADDGGAEGSQPVTVTYETSGGEERTVRADRVLVAVGRRPATDDLGLDAAGIEINDRGAIPVDEHLRTGIDGVYAVGDVNGGPQFTYVSYDDHRVVMSDRWGDGSRTAEDRVIPTTTFIDPPLSTVGLGEDAAREEVEGRGHELEVMVADVADLAIVPRPKILGNPAGMVKFLVDRDADRIVGASLFCVDSQELINTVAVAIARDVPASGLGSGIYTHPSTSEVFNAMLE